MAKFRTKIVGRRFENLVASFRGLPADYSPFINRKTWELSELVDQYKDKLGLNKQSLEQPIMQNWEAIIGKQFAHRTCPLTIRKDNILVISVPNSMIKSELEFKKREIIKKIKDLEGCHILVGVEFKFR